MLVSEQQPLRLNPAEVCEVIAAVCSDVSSGNTNVMTVSTRLSKNGGKPSMDVAVSVLIKLVIDMYVSLHFLSVIFHSFLGCHLFTPNHVSLSLSLSLSLDFYLLNITFGVLLHLNF